VTRLQAALADIAWLDEHWPMLVETRLPGTARPWRQTDISAEHRQQLDADARAERLDRAELAPGETPAPVHVDVLDVLTDITITAERLNEEAATAAGCRLLLPPAPSAYTDPRSYLAHFALHLDDIEPDARTEAASQLATLRRTAAGALRLVYDGQRIGDCPWCGQPRALVVRVPLSDALPMLVACEANRACEPPERDCGTWVRGRPTWPWHEWDWLAGRIRHAERHQHAC
jgi:hypothetical protein